MGINVTVYGCRSDGNDVHPPQSPTIFPGDGWQVMNASLLMMYWQAVRPLATPAWVWSAYTKTKNFEKCIQWSKLDQCTCNSHKNTSWSAVLACFLHPLHSPNIQRLANTSLVYTSWPERTHIVAPMCLPIDCLCSRIYFIFPVFWTLSVFILVLVDALWCAVSHCVITRSFIGRFSYHRGWSVISGRCVTCKESSTARHHVTFPSRL